MGNWYEERIALQDERCACENELAARMNPECNLCRFGGQLRFRMPTYDWQAVMWNLREAKLLRQQRCRKSCMKIVLGMGC